MIALAAAAGFAAAFAVARGDRRDVHPHPADTVPIGPSPIASAHLSKAAGLPELKPGGAPGSVIARLPSSTSLPQPVHRPSHHSNQLVPQPEPAPLQINPTTSTTPPPAAPPQTTPSGGGDQGGGSGGGTSTSTSP